MKLARNAVGQSPRRGAAAAKTVGGLLCVLSLACSDQSDPPAAGSPNGSAGMTNASGSGPGSGGGSGTSSPEARATLFQHCDYGGWAVGLGAGDYTTADLVALGALDDDASSVQVGTGYEIVLYAEDGFGGESIILRSDTACTVAFDFNDLTSSVSVREATGSGGSDPGSGGMPGSGGTLGASDDVYQACVDRINAFRATVGLPPYARDASSEACTDAQAKSDSETGDAHGAFGDCGEWAQNECPGWGSIEETIDGCLQAMWDEGPGGGHYDNMAGDYSETFCGFYTTPDGEVWAIQNFR